MASKSVTPSPRRFITGRATQVNTPGPSSSLRNQQTPSSQFAATPKFALDNKKSGVEVGRENISHGRLTANERPGVPIFTQSNGEEIDEAVSDQGGDEDSDITHQQPTKRQRRDATPDAILISSDPSSQGSAAATPQIVTTTPARGPGLFAAEASSMRNMDSHSLSRQTPQSRFVISGTRQNAKATVNSTPIPTRPPVILPPRSPSPPPLTASTFYSPSRRGQQYIPGGLAATLRDWIIDATQNAQLSLQRGIPNNHRPASAWDWTFTIDSVQTGEAGTGMALIRSAAHAEQDVPAQYKNWLLIGINNRGDAYRLQKGSTVGVKEPTWDLDLDGKTWRVGVEWISLP